MDRQSWAVLFSHPKDFTPVCTTELGYMAKIKPEFDKRGVKVIGLSVDPVDNHAKWADDIQETQGYAPNYPMIGDTDLQGLEALRHAAGRAPRRRQSAPPADNQTVRNVFVIGPDKKIKLILVYPMTTGRNFDEVLRVIDSLQLTAKHKVATPVNWKQGEDVIIAGSVSDDDAKKTYPQRLEIAEALHPHRPAARTITPLARTASGTGTSSLIPLANGVMPPLQRPRLVCAALFALPVGRQCATKTRYCRPPSASQASCLVHS